MVILYETVRLMKLDWLKLIIQESGLGSDNC